jgi:hypothetical protein
MSTWKSKICRGMDVVECITFTRQDITPKGRVITVSAAHVPGQEKPRDEWTAEEIDAIGETIAPTLDLELARLIAEEVNPTALEARLEALEA